MGCPPKSEKTQTKEGNKILDSSYLKKQGFLLVFMSLNILNLESTMTISFLAY